MGMDHVIQFLGESNNYPKTLFGSLGGRGCENFGKRKEQVE